MQSLGRAALGVMVFVLGISMAVAAPTGKGGKGGGGGKGGKRPTTACQSVQVPPTLTGTPPAGTIEGIAYAFRPVAADANCDALAFAISGKPAWASFDSTTGELAGTPPGGAAGLYPDIRIAVSDGHGATLLPAFDIRVSPNTVPVLSGTPPTRVNEGSAYAFRPSAVDPDEQPLRFSIANMPAWASFSSTTGQLSGTPSASHVGVTRGVTISVSDGIGLGTLTPFDVEVVAVNRAPSLSGTPPASATGGQAYSYRPTASDPDGDALGFAIANRPAWATFNTSNGSLSGTPPAGSAGSYSNIVISVSDGRLSASLPAFGIEVREPTVGSATLSWTAPTQRTDGTALTNLAGYRIRYGTTSGSYPNVITLNSPGLTSYVVENLSAGTYYFVMSSFDGAGVESANTNPASKTIH